MTTSLSTKLAFDDLVLSPEATARIEQIISSVQNSDTILEEWGFGRLIPKGITALFSGPSGTGKTLAATLIGKRLGREVLRVDLSRVLSKYIGETEKNLSRLVDDKESDRVMLLFDEADALFGKRKDVSDSHDRYANQEVSYLLQRIERHNGLVILAGNMSGEIDAAFLRRINVFVNFQRPDAGMRRKLWERAFPPETPRESGIDFDVLAGEHELTGAEIQNAVHFAAVSAVSRGAGRVAVEDVQAGVAAELAKSRLLPK